MILLTRKNFEFAKRVFWDRLGDPYEYAEDYEPNDVTDGADCSGSAGIFIGAALLGADRMSWSRQFSTETFPGPFKAFRKVSRADLLANPYPIKVCIHHGGGGPNSHMQITLDGIVMESNGSHGTCTTGTGAMDPADNYWNDWWALDGPIVEDGTPRTARPDLSEPKDTLFADVSEFQVPVTDAYTTAGYRWLSIRSNDGTHRDKNFAANYAWCKRAADDGRITGFMVYFYWRTGSGDVDTHMAMINEQGGPHPKMVSMIDLESGGNPGGDHSVEVNAEYARLQQWLGDGRRVIGYANLSDERSMWQFKPAHVPMILAGYGSNPSDPNVYKIAHQYTDGQGYGGGLPEGAPPFGNCDMNSADGFTPTQLAAALGVAATSNPDNNDDEEDGVLQTSRSIYRTSNEPTMSGNDASRGADATSHMNWVEQSAIRGEVWALLLVKATANGGIGATKWWEVNAGNPNPGIDPWAIEKATNVLNYIQAVNPTALQNAIGKAAS